MKKTLAVLASLAMLFTVISCGTTNEVVKTELKGTAATVATKRQQIIDYKGSMFGEPIPEWVKAVVNGEKNRLPKLLPNLEGKKIFIASERGDNIDFVKTWVDGVGLDQEIAKIFETNIAAAQQTASEGLSNEKKTSMTQSIKNFTQSLSSVRLSGLEQEADYWVQVERYDAEGNVATTYYEYYVIATMDQEIFDSQLAQALNGITDVTTESANLKEILKAKLADEVLGVEGMEF